MIGMHRSARRNRHRQQQQDSAPLTTEQKIAIRKREEKEFLFLFVGSGIFLLIIFVMMYLGEPEHKETRTCLQSHKALVKHQHSWGSVHTYEKDVCDLWSEDASIVQSR